MYKSQFPMPKCELLGSWELGVGSWELGVGSWELSLNQPQVDRDLFALAK
jgi:hypothetical protein